MTRTRRTVHPRVRGEHSGGDRREGGYVGSSPRARGTRPPGHHLPTHRRFIPACAGNTRARPTAGSATTVHPRVRGEHLGRGVVLLRMFGSSPRARGTRAADDGSCVCGRFIPACAGNTLGWRTARTASPVHPRVRGEHADTDRRDDGKVGSSPRARGTLVRHRHPLRPRRFIPACAGNTATSPVRTA